MTMYRGARFDLNRGIGFAGIRKSIISPYFFYSRVFKKIQNLKLFRCAVERLKFTQPTGRISSRREVVFIGLERLEAMRERRYSIHFILS